MRMLLLGASFEGHLVLRADVEVGVVSLDFLEAFFVPQDGAFVDVAAGIVGGGAGQEA